MKNKKSKRGINKMKYKVGDKVRVREDLEAGKFYNKYYFNSLMAKLKGKVVEIEDVDSDSYCIDGYYWTDEMFSGLAEEEPRNLIPLIAKELGVEMGEEFKISNRSDVYKFTEDKLVDIEDGIICNTFSILYELISGKENIIKLPKKPKLTEDERVILRNLPKQYRWIARDDGGELGELLGKLYVYEKKPDKGSNRWFDGGYFKNLSLFQHLFQFIKWEDEEPYKIQELLEEYENLRSE
jgi:hypothetical protein